MSRITFIQAPKKAHALLYRNPVFKAFMPKVMRQAQQVDLALSAREAFESVQKGTGTEDDRDILAGTANVVMVLAEKHCVQADLDAAIAAQDALLRADCRAADGKRWGFDGVGRIDMVHMLDAHEQMLACFGHAALTTALLEVMDRRARGQVHRIKQVQKNGDAGVKNQIDRGQHANKTKQNTRPQSLCGGLGKATQTPRQN